MVLRGPDLCSCFWQWCEHSGRETTLNTAVCAFRAGSVSDLGDGEGKHEKRVCPMSHLDPGHPGGGSPWRERTLGGTD